MDNQEELEHIRKVLNGEHAAYAFLVDRYKGMAYSIALKILENEEDAQDVAQEGFIKAYQQLHQFEGKSKFSTWLYTIVYRTALAKLKEAKVRTFSITQQFKDTFTDDYTAPQLALMQADDERRSVNLAVNNLPKTDALLVILYYIDGNSIGEVHQITGISVATIKIRLFRARKKLERELRFLLDDKSSGLKTYGKRGA
ncbi:MAG TPA: sigma-70 family RNA polymerase sigma factor [Chryseolinea sp.]|nr:sigma-70 family RNA polymerase sigma factor [Chryseolinea sp.]